jgi:hypothetical protein
MRVLLIFILSTLVFKSKSQSISKNSDIVKSLLGSEEIISSFHLGNDNDSLTLLDKNNWLAGECNELSKWGNHYLSIKYDSIISNKIHKTEPYYLFKNDCNTFILEVISKTHILVYISIHQPCSGLIAKVKVKISRKRVEIISVEKVVL